MSNRVFVVGVGQTPFTKPTKKESDGIQYPDLAKTAIDRALRDAGDLDPQLIEYAALGSMFNLGACQRALYHAGIYEIPMMNLNNACATGSSAMQVSVQNIKAGLSECAIAVGVEKMAKGPLGAGTTQPSVTSLDQHYMVLAGQCDLMDLVKNKGVPPLPIFFGVAGENHAKLYGTTNEQFAMVAQKNHKHSSNNPYAQFRQVYSLDEVLNSHKIYGPLTKLQCSPTSDGAACVILASEKFVIEHNLQGNAIEIAGQGVTSDSESALEFSKLDPKKTGINLVGSQMAKRAIDIAYKAANVSAKDLDVVELHDCFSCNELLTYEALGLCKEGEGGKLIEQGDVTYGGKGPVVNPSGGLISKGHPLGATGISQICELTWHLRNEAKMRQVDNCNVALSHNLGLGGLCVVTILKKPQEWKSFKINRKVGSGSMNFEDSAKL